MGNVLCMHHAMAPPAAAPAVAALIVYSLMLARPIAGAVVWNEAVACAKPCGFYRRELLQVSGSYRLPQPLAASCLCGTVQIRIIDAPMRMMHCHCSMCRRQGGGAFITWAAFDDAALQLLNGTDVLRTYHSSSYGYRRFCPVCGSTISLNYHGQPGTIWLAAGTVEGSLGCCPDSHIMVRHKAPWFDLTEHVLYRYLEGG
mmetsp:Transcript_138484/g.386306  ORF Transcript_138484/g.386306 Transcript_138484/m.386306 type:complete len:201 (+) Transcript_138484:26-628(+)